MSTSDDTTIQMKRCPKCGKELPATAEYFYRDSRAKDGLKFRCKQCKSEELQNWQQNNREHHIKLCRDWRNRNHDYCLSYYRQHYRENRDRILQEQRVYRRKHRERLAAKCLEYRQKNREKVLLMYRTYHEANRDKRNQEKREYNRKNAKRYTELRRQNLRRYALYASRRRARKLELPDSFTAQEWQTCLTYWNYSCAVCGVELDTAHADHWIPLNYKGVDNPGTVATNMICLCASCNFSKNDTMPEIWLTRRYSADKADEILKRAQTYFEWVKQ